MGSVGPVDVGGAGGAPDGPPDGPPGDGATAVTVEAGAAGRVAVARRSVVVAAWLALCAAVTVWLYRLGRGLGFFFDEWDWVLNRAHGVRTLLVPHNGHFSLLPGLVFRILQHTVGLDDYRPYRIVGLLTHAAVASVVARLITKRRGLPSGLAAGTVVLLLGSGAENILWPFQIGMMGSLGLGLAAWVLLDHRTVRADAGASALLFASLAAAGMGIPIMVGVVVRLAWTAPDRRRLWVVLPPGALYGVWWLAYGTSQGSADNLRFLFSYTRDMLAGDLAALGGRPLEWGLVALGVAGTALAVTVAQRRGASGGTAGVFAILLVNAALTTYARGDLHEPASGRYVYLGAVLVLALWAELYRRDRAADRARGVRRRLVLEVVVAVVLAAVAVKGNRYSFTKRSDGFHHTSDSVRAGLLAIEWAPTVNDAYRADPALAPPVFAGKYLAIVREFGSPAFSLAQLEAAGEDARVNADRVSLEIVGSTLTPPPAATGACAGPTASRTIEVGAAPGVLVKAGPAPVEVRLWRFASEAPIEATATIPAGATIGVTPPQDRGPATWKVLVTSRQAFVTCDEG